MAPFESIRASLSATTISVTFSIPDSREYALFAATDAKLAASNAEEAFSHVQETGFE